MNPTENLDHASAAPTIEIDSLPSGQPFETLLARYKGRVYEIYGNQIVGLGETTAFTRLVGMNPAAADP